MSRAFLLRVGGSISGRLGPLFYSDDGRTPGFWFLLVIARIGFLSLLPPTLLAVPGLPLGGRYS
jgi:hypothetical protein